MLLYRLELHLHNNYFIYCFGWFAFVRLRALLEIRKKSLQLAFLGNQKLMIHLDTLSKLIISSRIPFQFIPVLRRLSLLQNDSMFSLAPFARSCMVTDEPKSRNDQSFFLLIGASL